MLSDYQNKHVFLSESSSTHTLNLILNIINKDILKIDDVLVILYSTYPATIDNKSSLKKNEVNVLMWEDARNLEISFKTLNCLSLNSNNSGIICYFLDKNYVGNLSVNILIQDDEVDRWCKLFDKDNKLNVSEAALIDINTLKVLQEVDNYIVPYNTWGLKLENILGRKLNIIDVIIPFNLIDYSSQEILEKFISSRKTLKVNNNYKIMVFTKPTGTETPIRVLKFLSSYVSKPHNYFSSKEITISLWGSMSLQVVFLTKLLNKLFRKLRIAINITLLDPVPHAQYFLTVNDYDCLILQPRGGFSTAKYFAEKVGKVITITNSLNDLTFKQDYQINTFNSPTLESAIDMAIESANIDDSERLSSYSASIKTKHTMSFKTLKNYWKNFD